MPWVRQHHDTCAPATLSAVCAYWQWPADHLDVVEEICFGGTPAHSERQWARDNGLVAREMTVDWPTVVALIDRGVPFTLVTRDAVNAHLQAVVGYDAKTRSLFCRDPSHRHLTEIDGPGLFETLVASGPRGMVLLPPAEAHRLDGLPLPDAELYDQYHLVEGHLAAHRRDRAVVACRQLETLAPDHRLTRNAAWALSAYDRDVPKMLTVVDALLERFPDDARLQLARLSLQEDVQPRDERLAELRERADRPQGDPSFQVMLAAELLNDASTWPEAQRRLIRANRWRPHSAPTYDLLGRLACGRGARRDAVRLFRWAACLAEAVEDHQLRYL